MPWANRQSLPSAGFTAQVPNIPNLYQQTEEELIANFRIILMRFAQYKIKINPDKLRVGMEGIEVVGHTL